MTRLVQSFIFNRLYKITSFAATVICNRLGNCVVLIYADKFGYYTVHTNMKIVALACLQTYLFDNKQQTLKNKITYGFLMYIAVISTNWRHKMAVTLQTRV